MASDPAGDELRPALPLLIVPGIICSALRVEQSEVCPEWEGARLFAPSVSKILHGSLKRTGTWREGEEAQLQNRLLHHFVLKSPSEESEGLRVRAIEGGLAGLNLFDGAEEEAQVTGFRQGNLYAGVIKVLRAAGYSEEDGSLEGAAYDWRLAPGVLQSRDNFFARLKQQIERMSRRSRAGKGVVILGHSMGNKVVQYFLSYIMESPGGQTWLDSHVYSWLIVGAPLLGAAYCGRMVVAGDSPYPGIDSIFSRHELVILFRSLSSLPWLFPIGAQAVHLFYLRREGALEVKCLGANLPGYGLSAGNKVKLLVEVIWGSGHGRAKVCSHSSASFDGEVATFHPDDSFIRFGGPPDLPRDARLIVTVCEKGLDDGIVLCPDGDCSICCLPCTLIRIACLSVLRGLRGYSLACRAVGRRVISGQDVGERRAASEAAYLSGQCRRGEFVTQRLRLQRRLLCCNPFTARRGDVTVQVRWLNARALHEEWSDAHFVEKEGMRRQGWFCKLCGRCAKGLAALVPCLQGLASPEANQDEVPIRHNLRPEIYDKMDLSQMLRMLGCERALRVWEEYYKSDPLYNNAGTFDAPPVKRAVAISGCDVRTEVGCVFRLNTHRTSDKTNVRTRFVPDTEAELAPDGGLSRGHSLSGGVLFEEPGGETPSGDGTVPFCSLHHSSTWANKIQYEEHLLSKSAHSMNMIDPRFHKLLMKVLTPTPD